MTIAEFIAARLYEERAKTPAGQFEASSNYAAYELILHNEQPIDGNQQTLRAIANQWSDHPDFPRIGLRESAAPQGTWDKPPSKRFWVTFFAAIIAIAVVVGIIIGMTNSLNELHEKTRKSDAWNACRDSSQTVDYRKCMDAVE